MSTGVTIQALRECAQALEGGGHREVLVAIQRAQDALDAAKAHHLGQLVETRAFELDGASSVVSWARDHLRLESHQTKQYVRADATMRALPAVAEVAVTGGMRLEHLNLFGYGLRHVGTDIIGVTQDWLLRVATEQEPAALRQAVKEIREAVYPDELDEAWIKGMDKQDLQVNPVPEGYHVRGFLNTATGAKLRAVLDSLSAPKDKDDRRTGPERRVSALDTLVSSILENGLPSDKGIRPQMLVTVDVETLHDALTTKAPTAKTGAPARLAGFGPIGPRLLSYLGCVSDLTPILTQGGELPQARVLNVDRTHRLATPRQRKAVIVRQGGQCAGPGCSNTHLEVHHSTWWSQGGKTDLDDLAGYCKTCHLLIHRGLLVVKARGKGLFEHTTSTGTPVRRRTRTGWNRDLALIRQIATDIRHQRHQRHAWMNTDTG